MCRYLRNMNTKTDALDEVATLPVYRLSDMADCPEPSDETGRLFLVSIRNDFVDRAKHGYEDEDELIHEVADNAPSLYTHRMWCEFVELCAYREDVSDYVTNDTDMEQRARVALYMIAERLVRRLVEELADIENEEEEVN